jgi:exopolysaccharide production protein ExoQ
VPVMARAILLITLVGATGAFQAFPLGSAITYLVYVPLFLALTLAALKLLTFSVARRPSSTQLTLAFAATTPLILSAVWSDSPSRTLADSLAMLAFVFIAWTIAKELTSVQAMTVIAYLLTGFILLSYLTVLLLPEYGIDNDSRGDLWRGIFANKNAFGRVCAIAFLIWVALHSSSGGRRKVGVALALLLAGTGLLMSGSMTALAAAIVGLAILISARSVGVGRILGIGTAALTIGVFVCVSAAIPSIGPRLATWFSRDSTLTGRVGLWEAVSQAIADSPYLGRGFSATWQVPGGIGARISSTVGFESSSAHNGLLDMQLQIGLVGTIALLVFLTLALAGALKRQGTDLTCKPFVLALVGFLLTMDLAESVLLFGLVWFLMWLFLLATPSTEERRTA